MAPVLDSWTKGCRGIETSYTVDFQRIRKCTFVWVCKITDHKRYSQGVTVGGNVISKHQTTGHNYKVLFTVVIVFELSTIVKDNICIAFMNTQMLLLLVND